MEMKKIGKEKGVVKPNYKKNKDISVAVVSNPTKADQSFTHIPAPDDEN